MKWNEMTAFRKIAVVVCVLCLIISISLAVLKSMDILTGMELFEDIVDCLFWVAMGIVYWKKERLVPVVCFVLAGLRLISVFL